MLRFDDGERKPQSRHYRTRDGQIARVCDECGAGMVVRTNHQTGEEFLGCSNYRDCLHTEPLPEDEKMHRAGVRGFFDEERE